MTNANDPATGFAWSQEQQGTSGLTKREYFSAMAMQGILAKHGLPADGWDRDNLQEKLESATFASVTLADALIKALNQQ